MKKRNLDIFDFTLMKWSLIVSSSLNQKPRRRIVCSVWFGTWSIGMDAFSRFVERLILGDGLTPLENTINFVFLRFSASLFAWNQWSTLPNSSLHLSCSSVAFSALIMALMSSAQRFFKKADTSGKSFMYKMKRRTPKILPWRTPNEICLPTGKWPGLSYCVEMKWTTCEYYHALQS